MIAPLIVAGSAAERLKGWGVQATACLTSDDQRKLAPELIAEVCAVTPLSATDSSERHALDEPPLDGNLALYVSTAVLRKLGLYDGTMVEVRSTTSAKQLVRLHAAVQLQSPGSSQQDSCKVLLTPLLAHNLGLQHELGPFLTEPLTKPGPGLEAPSRRQQFTVKVSRLPTTSDPPALTYSQPGRGSAAVTVATSVCLAKIAVPEQQLFDSAIFRREESPAEGSADNQASKEAGSSAEMISSALPAGPAVESAAEDIIDDLKAYLTQHRHIVSMGDVIPVARRQLAPQESVLHSLSGMTSVSSPSLRTQPLYYMVTEVQPADVGPVALDPAQTDVRLQGTCRAALPVGLQRYAASLQERPPSACPRPARSLGVRSPPLPDELSADSAHACQLSALPAPTEIHEADADEDERALTERRGSHALAGSLGWDAEAAWRPQHAHLPGIGSLMPSWQHVARTLAPIFHKGSAAFPLRAALLVHGPPGSGRATAVKAACMAMGLHFVPYGCAGLHAGTQSVAPSLRAAFQAAQHFAPGVLLLTDFEALAGSSAEAIGNAASHEGEVSRLTALLQELTQPPAASEQSQVLKDSADRMIVVACCCNLSDVPADLRRCFTHEIAAEAPDADMRECLLEGFLGKATSERLGQGSLQDLAAQTAGLMPRDLAGMVADCAADAVTQDVDVWQYMTSAQPGDPLSHRQPIITEQHLFDALASLRKRTATAIGAPQVPNVRWEDVGGLEHVKRTILDTVELPLKHPSLFATGLRRRSGILLYGPPGTGKTLVAKAVATECAINFLSVKGPELINMYIGESERQVREIFNKARRARPCILFFDELDSLAPARGAGADSGGVMDRVVAQLLAELDGAQTPSEGRATSAGNDIFVIGATNRPDLLDVALMRPGRLDKLLYVGVADDPSAKLSVLTALTRKFQLAGDVDLAAVARECAVTFTGADMYALAADAWTSALKRLVAEGLAEDAEVVEVAQRDFWMALKGLTPSLSAAEMQRYESLGQQFESGHIGHMPP